MCFRICCASFAVLLASCQVAEISDSPLVVNEISAKSLAGPDWIELYNPSDESLDISGFQLVDAKEGHVAYRIPDGTVLAPHAYYVARRQSDPDDPPGFEFGLGAADTVTLFDREGLEVDRLAWGDGWSPSGRSYGRFPDGREAAQTLTQGSPGLPNAAPCPGCGGGVVAGPSSKCASLYAEFSVIDIVLAMTDANEETLMKSFDEGEAVWVPCHVAIDGEIFEFAEIRAKGSPFDWNQLHFQKQYMIRFNGLVDGGRFRGLRRMNLDAQRHDPTRIRNNIGMFVMRRAGLLAPRTNHARLVINGEYHGFYENIEVIDKEFLEDRFANPERTLFEGHELKTNEETDDTSRFDLLVDVANSYDGHDLLSYAGQLDQQIDCAHLMTVVAAESALASPKNFWADGLRNTGIQSDAWNFYLYDQSPSDGFVVLPWDLDSVLHPAMVSPTVSVYDFSGEGDKPVASPWAQLQNHPDWRAYYIAELERIQNEILAGLDDDIVRYCALVRPYLAHDPNYGYTMDEFDQGCDDLRAFLSERRAYLDEVIAAR